MLYYTEPIMLYYTEPKIIDSLYPEEVKQEYRHKEQFLDLIIKLYAIDGVAKKLERKENSNRYTVSTQLDNNINRHILSLDIDGENNLYAAMVSLERRGIQFEIFESSKGNHWIITNHVGPLNEVLEMLKILPGVDEEFCRFSRIRHHINLRAINRGDQFPKLITDTSTRGGIENTYHNTAVLNWINEFNNHFIKLEHMWKDMKLKKALANNELGAYLANPEIEA